MIEIFDFCEETRVIKEVAPEEADPINMNGWDFTVRPHLPYRRTFVGVLHGLRWEIENGVLTLSGDTAGRLLKFYRDHRLYKSFRLNHEYLGPIHCRFKQPVNIEPALADADGLIEAFEVTLIHHNPGY